MSLQEREEKSQTQGGCHVKMVTEIREPCHQVKENIRAWGEAQEARRKQEIVSLTVSRIISPANILILNFCLPQLKQENKFLLLKPPSL